MPPGSAAPLGRHFHTPRSPRLPRSPARSLGASQGPRGAARAFGICASDVRAEESCPFQERWQEEECCHREDERWMVMPATHG